jgi:hypothetical protein
VISFPAGRARRKKDRLNFSKSGRTNSLEEEAGYSVAPEV